MLFTFAVTIPLVHHGLHHTGTCVRLLNMRRMEMSKYHIKVTLRRRRRRMLFTKVSEVFYIYTRTACTYRTDWCIKPPNLNHHRRRHPKNLCFSNAITHTEHFCSRSWICSQAQSLRLNIVSQRRAPKCHDSHTLTQNIEFKYVNTRRRLVQRMCLSAKLRSMHLPLSERACVHAAASRLLLFIVKHAQCVLESPVVVTNQTHITLSK